MNTDTLAASPSAMLPIPTPPQARLLAAFGAVLLAIAALLFTGCHTQDVPGRLLTTTVQTVDGAMQGWGSYVALGKATAEQETTVRAAYSKYQSAEAAAEAAYVASAKTGDASVWQRASDALRASQGALITLVNQFTQGKTP